MWFLIRVCLNKKRGVSGTCLDFQAGFFFSYWMDLQAEAVAEVDAGRKLVQTEESGVAASDSRSHLWPEERLRMKKKELLPWRLN